MKLIIKSTLIILFLSCNLSNKGKTQSRTETIPFDSIERYVDTLLMDALINSLSLGIHFKGKEIVKQYGELDKGKKNKPTNKTIYEIASVTKTFVGTLIAQSEIEGKLSIEDDIRKYLGAGYENLEFEDNPIRIKHLLTHTSELPRFLPESINELFAESNDDLPFRIAEIENNYSKSRFLEDLKKVEIDTIPGTRFTYSNADTDLAAYILERVHDKSFNEILVGRICNVENMPDTRIILSEEQKKRLANGYGSNGKTTPHMSTTLWGASGAGKSTPIDLMNYIKFQLNELNEPVQKTHQSLYGKEPIFGDPNNSIGYFWIINEDQDFGKVVSQHGGAFGSQNWIFLYPEVDLGISIITNQGDWQTGGKLMYVVNGIINEIKKGTVLKPK